ASPAAAAESRAARSRNRGPAAGPPRRGATPRRTPPPRAPSAPARAPARTAPGTPRRRTPPTSSRQQPEQLRQLLAHLLAVDDGVDHPVLQKELAPLEPLGQLLADGLLDHPRPGESDQRLRLGEDDVAEKGER